jgi:hypothetical protein
VLQYVPDRLLRQAVRLRLQEQSRDYRSLDLDSNDFEESHYLGHRAFGQLVLDPISTNDGPSASPVDPNVPGQRLYYRQVASARDPAYFLRNPSMPYGLANTDFAAEKAYGAVIAILRQVQEDLPERLVQMCVCWRIFQELLLTLQAF